MICNLFIINEEVIFNANVFELRPINNRDEVITLNAPTARCLKLLLERVGQVVSREDFMQEVWQARGIVVSQNTFYQNISLLRKSLQQVGLNADIIATVRGVGFIFSPDARVQFVEDEKSPAYVAVNMNSDRAEPHLNTGVINSTLLLNNENTNKNLSVHLEKTHLKIPKWVIVLIIICVALEIFSLILRYIE